MEANAVLPVRKADDWPVILLIENDDNDVFFLRRALTQLCYDCSLRVVGTAAAARAYLENAGEFTAREYHRPPKLIVCDFKLQEGTALGFIQWLRSDPRFKSIPVVMLSGLASKLDPALFAGLDIKAFLRKPSDIAMLGETLRPNLP